MTKKAFCCQISGFELRSFFADLCQLWILKRSGPAHGKLVKGSAIFAKVSQAPPKSLLDYVRKVK